MTMPDRGHDDIINITMALYNTTITSYTRHKDIIQRHSYVTMWCHR